MDPIVILALHLVHLTGPGGQEVDVNPQQVVSLREKHDDEHFANKVRCLIHTTDGKFIAVLEDCVTVQQKLDQADQED